MKYKFLHKNGNGRLILIFAGWSTDETFYSGITLPGWDTLVAYGYDDLDFPTEILTGYHTISLFAWSLGVYAASRAVPPSMLSMAVAVNGTEFPVSDSLGIPGDIFIGTMRTLSGQNLIKFQKRMAANEYSAIKDRLTVTDIDSLRNQLKNIAGTCASPSPRHEGIRWNRVFISSADRIFPSANQQRAWERNIFSPEIVTIESPHYVDLLPIVKSALPSHEKIGGRFQKALPTYNDEASAQREIARRLADMCGTEKRSSIVEIGPGSGIFSEMIAERLVPDTIDFIDLYPLPGFDIKGDKHYHVADAEEWIAMEAERNPFSRDAIVSASSIQWFANPRLFFKNAARLLRPGGLLACSTFLPGNLRELQAVNPLGIIYRSRDEIESMVRESFDPLSIEEDSITLTFGSSRQTLRHLRNTGVGGNSPTGLSIKEISSRLPSTLTYRPLFVTARTRCTS